MEGSKGDKRMTLDTILQSMREQGRTIDQFAINEARAMLAHKGRGSIVTLGAIGNRIEFKPREVPIRSK